MKIAMVTAMITRKGAGVAASIEGLSRALISIGHDVKVFALADRDGLAPREPWTGAPSIEFPVTGPEAFGFAPQMLRSLIEWGPDILHLHGLWMYTSRAASAWHHRTGRPFVISPHGMLAPAALAFSPQKKLLARLLYQDRCFANASAFQATCDAEASDIRRFGIDQQVDIVPLGTHKRSRPNDCVRRKTVLSLGRLHPVKGLDLLIRAWAQLEAKFVDWDLKIVGPDEDGYKQQLQDLIAHQGLQRCEIHAPLYGDAKYRCLAEASVFVLPSHSENFGLTVLESLLMQTPVIASRGTPWSSLTERGCGDWVPLEERSFAVAMSKLMAASDSERESMGARGRNLVLSSFSWQAVAEEAEASYARVLIRNSL